MNNLINIKIAVLFVCFGMAACSPTVKVEAPDKPIEINLNVNIEQRVKIEIQQEVKQAIAANPNIF